MPRFMKSYLPLCMLLFAIAGCHPVQWARPNTSDAQLQTDNRNCQSKAASLNQTVRLQVNSPDNANTSLAAQSEWQSCMRSLGYTTKSSK